MVIAAGDTADKANLGLVVHAQTVHVLAGLEEAVALHDKEAVAGKCMPRHNNLNRDGCLRNVEAKITGCVGLDLIAVSVFDDCPVHQEMRPTHRNGGVAEQHASREANRLGIDKINARSLRTLGVKCYRSDTVGVAVIGEFAVLRGRRNGEGGASVERHAAESVRSVLIADGLESKHRIIGATYAVDSGLVDIQQQVGTIVLADVLECHVADIATDSALLGVGLRTIEGVVVGQQRFLARQIGVGGGGYLFGVERTLPNPHLVEIDVCGLVEQIHIALGRFSRWDTRLLVDGFAVLVEGDCFRTGVAHNGYGCPRIFLDGDRCLERLRAVLDAQFSVVAGQFDGDAVAVAGQRPARGQQAVGGCRVVGGHLNQHLVGVRA